MITWAHPELLPLALLGLLAFVQPRLTGRQRLTVSGPAAFRDGLTLRRALAPVPRALTAIALALLVAALARPQIIHRRTVVTSEGLDILLAVDTSGSMRAEDFSLNGQPTTRLAVAKGVLDRFVQERPNDRIGLVVFGEEAFTHVPLTLDHEALQGALAAVQIGVAGESRTAIGQALAVAAKRLKELEAPSKIVVLLTDGRNNAGRVGPIQAAEAAAALGIRVYTVGIGAPPRRTLFRTDDGVDERMLRTMAELTGGRYYLATSSEALAQVYAQIDALEPSTAEVEELVDTEELFARWAAPGLLAWLLGAVLSATWLRRFP